LLKDFLAALDRGGILARGRFLGCFCLRQPRAGYRERHSQANRYEHRAHCGKSAVHDFSPVLQ
jgi:hypothetical protein